MKSFLQCCVLCWLFAGVALANSYYLAPTADAFVKNDSATTNFGTDTTFISDNSSGVRVSFLRFSLSGVPKPISSARLQCTVSATSFGQNFNVYALTSGTNWTETGLTWNTAPAVVTAFTTPSGTTAEFLKTSDLLNNGAVMATFTSGSSGALDTFFDVTSGPLFEFLNTATGDVTLVIAESGAADSGGVGWSSREATSCKPMLIVTTGTPPTLLRVVLIAGQSNADGRAVGSDLPTAPINYQATQNNVPYYYFTVGMAFNSDGTYGSLATMRPGETETPSDGFGPEVGMSYALSRVIEQQSGAVLAVVKYAKGSTSLSGDWKANGNPTTTNDGARYVTFQKVVTDGLARLRAAYPAATVKLAGMIWVQGERDIDLGSATVAAYAANLTRFIADIRATFDPGLPFFFSRISSNQTVYSTPTDPNYADYLTLRAQQEQVAANVPGAYLIDTDGSNFTVKTDYLHFDTGGQLALGNAFAARLGDLLRLRVTTLTSDGSGVHLNWNQTPGRSYQVETSPNLQTWTPHTVGAVGTWTDTEYTGLPQRFYRVVEED